MALGYTHLFGANKVLDARLGLSRTKAGKYTLSIGQNAFTIPGLQPCQPDIAGGLPQVSISSFTAFGRQSTNPQWQNPALLDPKVNFTWVKGKHSLKFGYEYEHIWMAVNDNNPLYGSWTYGGGYSATQPARPTVVPITTGPISCSAHQQLSAGQLLRGPSAADTGQRLRTGRLEGPSQPDAEPRPALGVRLALLGVEEQHLQLRSCIADGAHHHSGRSSGQRHHAGHRWRRLRQDAGQSRL